ncbi:MAG TPA: TlpA disulfide reductase family protein [Bacteroidales bacterium]|nr:TlpA disulfide reductase family protein [Bacteroidales bacterium]HQI70541.1 TlpA disulfide reductase family protein [Bacteroidales bacterium]
MTFRKFLGFLCLAAALVFIGGCSNHNTPVDEFIIHGKLKNSLGEKIILQRLSLDSIKSVDSLIVDENGEFTFKYKPGSIGFYLLKVAGDNFIMLLTDKGEKIEITGNIKQLANDYAVTGSAGSVLLCELNNYTRKNIDKTDSLYNVQLLYQDSTNFPQVKQHLDSVYNNIFEDQRRYVQGFIKKNRTSLASIIAIYQVFGRQKVLNERDHLGTFKMLDSTLFLLYPNNDYVLELHKRVGDVEKAKADKIRNLAKLDSAMVAPEIKMNGIGGNPQPLSSLKGHVTLVLFWATSSQPSVASLKQYKWIHKKYREKGFQVYAVSLDKNRRDWEYAVNEHRLSWINASDLLGWDSPVVKTYCIDNIPLAVLVDTDGRILKRGITEEELPAWLNKIYKF